MKIKRANPPRPGSYERVCHDQSCATISRRTSSWPKLVHLHIVFAARAIRRFIWFRETEAVTPLAGPEKQGGDETWPFGL